MLWRVVNEAHVNLSTLGPVRDVSHRLERWPLAAAVVVVAAGVVAFVVIASTVGYVLAFWRFRVTRHSGGTLQVTRGLITTRATSIEQRRLRGAEVSEPLLLRSVRGARCLAIATGLRVGRGAERGGEILLPPAPRAAAVSLAATVIGTDVPFTEALARHPIAARRRRLTRTLAGTRGAGRRRGRRRRVRTLAGRGCWSSPPCSPARPSRSASIATAASAMRSPAITLSLGIGTIVRRRSALQTDGVIGWNIRRSYFQRRAGLASLTATTAAGRQRYKITDISDAEAVAFADATVPALLTEFLAE